MDVPVISRFSNSIKTFSWLNNLCFLRKLGPSHRNFFLLIDSGRNAFTLVSHLDCFCFHIRAMKVCLITFHFLNSIIDKYIKTFFRIYPRQTHLWVCTVVNIINFDILFYVNFAIKRAKIKFSEAIREMAVKTLVWIFRDYRIVLTNIVAPCSCYSCKLPTLKPWSWRLMMGSFS